MSGMDGVLQAAYDRMIEHQLSYRPFQTPESIARAQQRERERQAKLETAVAEARRQWEVLFHRTNEVGKAVLGLHEPEAGYDTAICACCWAPDEYGDAAQGEWPCATFLAVRDA